MTPEKSLDLPQRYKMTGEVCLFLKAFLVLDICSGNLGKLPQTRCLDKITTHTRTLLQCSCPLTQILIIVAINMKVILFLSAGRRRINNTQIEGGVCCTWVKALT